MPARSSVTSVFHQHAAGGVWNGFGESVNADKTNVIANGCNLNILRFLDQSWIKGIV